MSVEEMKKAISEKVETLTEEQLMRVSNYIDSINQTPGKECDLLPHVEDIVKEREEVLKKLAQ